MMTIFVVLILLSLSSSVASYAYYGGYMGGSPRIYRLYNEKMRAYTEGDMTRDEFIENVIPWLCKPANLRVLGSMLKNENRDDLISIMAVQGDFTDLAKDLPRTPEGEYDTELLKMIPCM